MNTDIEELSQYLWTDLTSTASVALRIMQKIIQALSFSALQRHTASWSPVGIAGTPATGKTTLAHLLTERINLEMTVFLPETLTEHCLRWEQDETSDDALQPTFDVHAIPLHDPAIWSD